jgi:hypothetical protein
MRLFLNSYSGFLKFTYLISIAAQSVVVIKEEFNQSVPAEMSCNDKSAAVEGATAWYARSEKTQGTILVVSSSRPSVRRQTPNLLQPLLE